MIGIAALLVGLGVLWLCFALGVYFFTRTGREGMRIQRMEEERQQHLSPTEPYPVKSGARWERLMRSARLAAETRGVRVNWIRDCCLLAVARVLRLAARGLRHAAGFVPAPRV